MSYRPPSHPPVTAWARHLDQVMQDRDWSRVRLFEEVAAELGYAPKSRSALLPLLIAKEPKPEQAKVLARHFGEPPQAAPQPTTATETPDPSTALISAMTAALLAQTTALTDLRVELAEMRETMTTAREAALSERQAMTRMLGQMDKRLREIQTHAGTAAATVGRESGRR